MDHVLIGLSDTWRLVNPPARPHLENSLRRPSAAHNGQVTAMATRITARVEGGGYHSNRSVFCTIL
ncbi:F-box only protein 10 [Saguinus oedipus]|uniref:F-box only protein 10 n=1 Tax=Saguinus oedipus TaxID=9490 RepID=A0ABQ9WGS8_SAGOE|nr:F-box only protein 10 [Saguinus oedipus]